MVERRVNRYQGYGAPAMRIGAGASIYQVARMVAKYMTPPQSRGQSPRKRQKTAPKPVFRPSGVRRAGIYKSYRYRKGRKMTVADKALKNVGFQRAYFQTASRASSTNGQQALRLISTGLNDVKMFKCLASVNPSFNPDLRSYVANWKTCIKNIMITNATNNQMVVYVYEMLAKKDLDENLLETAEQADDKLADGDLVPFTETNVAYVPTSAPGVYNRWTKQGRVYYRIMDPGSVWSIKIVTNINKRFNTTNMKNASILGTDVFNHKGITSQTLLRFHGTPASRSNEEGTVTLAPGRLEWTCSETYTFKHVDNMQNQTELMQGFNTNSGTMDIINDETGGRTNIETA